MLAVAALAACQPVEEPLPEADGDPSPAPGDAEDAVGAPDETVPGDLAGLLARTGPEAERWQAGARPAEATVGLDEGEWTQASVTYVAADADSALVVVVDGDGLATERISFASLGLEPLPEAAVADLPPLADLTAPTALAAAAEEHFADCDATPPADEVRLATGAPATWDGDRWAQSPQWRAVVTGAEGLGVRLDAAEVEPAGDEPCVDAALPHAPDSGRGDDEPAGGPGADPGDDAGEG